jgi:hypothetical protein
VLVSDLRQRSHDLLAAPSIAAVPRLNEDPDAVKSAAKLLALKEGVTPKLKYTTRSDSGLLSYAGAVLGVRQLILLASKRLEEPLPPGFGDAPSEMLALMGLRMPHIMRNLPVPESYPKHGPDVVEVIDAWDAGGLGVWARPAFFLSHVPVRGAKQWVPLTFDLER